MWGLEEIKEVEALHELDHDDDDDDDDDGQDEGLLKV